MSRVNVYQLLNNQGLATTLWVDNNTDVLLEDQDGSVTRPYYTMQQAMDHISNAPPGQFGVPGSLFGWLVTVNPGTYVDSFSIPPNRAITIEAPIRSTTVGDCTWVVENNFTCLLTLRNIGIGSLVINDGYNSSTLAVMALENVSINGITQSGSSIVDVSLAGISNASAEFAGGLGASSVCSGDIIINSLLIATGTAFLPTCTLISANQLNLNNCVIYQNIQVSDDSALFSDCIWSAPNTTVSYLQSYNSTTMDESSASSFLESGGEVVNGRLLIATQRSTGWLQGGDVNRLSNLDVNVSDGYGYIFEFDDVTAFVSWSDTTLTLAPNSTLDIYVDITNTVRFGPNPIDIKNNIILATASTNSSDVVFLNKNIVEAVQIAPNVDNFLQQIIGPVVESGIIASIDSPPSLQIDVNSGYFYIGTLQHFSTANSPINFSYWYQDGYGGWITVQDQNIIDADNYDDGSGILSNLPVGEWKKDILYVATSDDGTEYHIVYGQEIFASSELAQDGELSSIPPVLQYNALKCAGVVIQGEDTFITLITSEFVEIGGNTQSVAINNNGITATQHETLRQLIHFVEEGPADGFATGAYKEILPMGNPFPTSVTWYSDTSKTGKIVEKNITRNSIQIPTTITWKVYDTDGITVAHTVSDSINYMNNIFEVSRTRTIN